VIFQVAVSIVLLVGSGLLIRSLTHLTNVDLGFDPDHLLTGTVRILDSDYATAEQRHLFHSSLLEEIEAEPGVTSAAMISKLPIRNPWQDWPVWRAEDPRPARHESFFAMARWVSPGYFETLRIPLLKGRDVSARDVAGSPLVVVLSRAAARTLFPDREPIGQSVKLGWTDDPYLVIGVAADAHLNVLRDLPDPAFYAAVAQMEATGIMEATQIQVAVRTMGNPEHLLGSLEDLLRRKDANAHFAMPATMRSVVDDALGDFRTVILSLGLFSGVALLLAAIGLYGVLAYHVQQRANEMAIRLALGASPATILGLILKQGMVLVGSGLLLGLFGAWSASRLIRQLLFETQPLDATTYASASLFLFSVALLACVLPAWRASRVSVVGALRNET